MFDGKAADSCFNTGNGSLPPDIPNDKVQLAIDRAFTFKQKLV